jgi:hypothetical protein
MTFGHETREKANADSEAKASESDLAHLRIAPLGRLQLTLSFPTPVELTSLEEVILPRV